MAALQSAIGALGEKEDEQQAAIQAQLRELGQQLCQKKAAATAKEGKRQKTQPAAEDDDDDDAMQG